MKLTLKIDKANNVVFLYIGDKLLSACIFTIVETSELDNNHIVLIYKGVKNNCNNVLMAFNKNDIIIEYKD